MKRLFLVCALFGLCVVGCNKTSDSANQTVNKSAAANSSVATPTPVGQPTKNGNKASDKTAENAQGDVTGAYFPTGTLPSEFSEIDFLSLATIDDQGKPAPLNGFIRPKRKSAKDYQLVNPKIDGKNLTFSTTTVGGIGYKFRGTFERLDNFSANSPPSDEVILKGTLTKLSDGEEIALTKVSFTYSAGG